MLALGPTQGKCIEDYQAFIEQLQIGKLIELSKIT